MRAWMQNHLTTEAVFSIFGVVWFVAGAFVPALPKEMDVPALLPGVPGFAITPGLLVGLSLVPVILKAVTGVVPFTRTLPAVAPAVVAAPAKED